MATFPLKIVCPDGQKFDGAVTSLTVRTTTGEMGILAHHTDCVAPLGMGRATVVTEDVTRYGACIGGMISVLNGEATIVCTTFEWADEIDLPRAERSAQKARTVLENKTASDADIRLAQARLRRALIRQSTAAKNNRF